METNHNTQGTILEQASEHPNFNSACRSKVMQRIYLQFFHTNQTLWKSWFSTHNVTMETGATVAPQLFWNM